MRVYGAHCRRRGGGRLCALGGLDGRVGRKETRGHEEALLAANLTYLPDLLKRAFSAVYSYIFTEKSTPIHAN